MSRFNTAEVVNGISDKLLEFKPIEYVITNPIMVALVIGITTFIVVLIIYYDCSSARTFMAIRSGVWVFIITCGIFVLHQHHIDNVINDARTGIAQSALFNRPANLDDAVAVSPLFGQNSVQNDIM